MNRHLRILGAVAAALAVSAAAPAMSQVLDGAPRTDQQTPRLFENQVPNRDWEREDDRDDRDRDRDRDSEWDRERRPDFQWVQGECSKAGIYEAWRRNYYSAQYHEGPRLERGRYGWEMRGRMRLHDRRGYSYVNTVCDVRNRGDVEIEFLR
jgi:hypothetical protein